MRPNVLNYACVGAAETGKLFYGSFSAKQNRCNGVNMKQEKEMKTNVQFGAVRSRCRQFLKGLPQHIRMQSPN